MNRNADTYLPRPLARLPGRAGFPRPADGTARDNGPGLPAPDWEAGRAGAALPTQKPDGGKVVWALYAPH